MSATTKDIAEAVRLQLYSGAFAMSIEPVRSYADWTRPIESDELSEDGPVLVDVVAVTTDQSAEPLTDTSLALGVSVDIAVRRKFGTESLDDETGAVEIEKVDALVELVEQIYTLFALDALSTLADVTWKETKIMVNPLIRLLKMKQFTGVVRISFQASKSVA